MLARWISALFVGALACLGFGGPLTAHAAAVVTCPPGTTCPTESDLGISLTPPAGTVYVGEAVTVTATLTNFGPRSTRLGSTAAISIPGTSPPLGPTGGERTCVVQCTLSFGWIPRGAVQTRSIVLRPQIAGPVAIAATITANPSVRIDKNAANDTASTSVTAVIGRCTSVLNGLNRRDVLNGSIGGDVMNGFDGNDDLRGGPGDDCMEGGVGRDYLFGGPGNDVLKGGDGNDTIVGGPGHDKVAGGDGPDKIDTVDGVRDTVSCGFGRDRLTADKFDRFHGCERVRLVGGSHRRS